jgi:hypothetical protein
MLTGYLHPDYAASHSEFGSPIYLSASGGWLLARRIGDSGFSDAMGCYPLFCCMDWDGLRHDLETLRDQLISIVVVTDPFGKYSSGLLNTCFDHVKFFKHHYVIETGRPLAEFVKPSHRREALHSMRHVDVQLCSEPLNFLDDWDHLYGVLAARYSITGLRRFSRRAFEKQLAIPGMVMFQAVAGQRTVGFDLWYLQGNCAQNHLVAYDPVGYKLGASYALKWRAIEYFSNRAKWINLGAGRARDSSDGLSYFKQGWATSKKPVWLCGRVLQSETYAELSRVSGTETDYFPAYRNEEF